MTPDALNLISGLFNVWLWVKLFSLVLVLFYFVLSLVIVRQVDLMGQILKTEVVPALRTASLLHAAAVGILFILVVILI